MDRHKLHLEWDGPLVVAPPERVNQLRLPAAAAAFLMNIGMPSNALGFDGRVQAIMSFDSVSCLRLLRVDDVSPIMRAKVCTIGELAIVGVFGSQFITLSKDGTLWMVDSRPLRLGGEAADETVTRSILFMNSGISEFAACLLAYRDFRRIAFDVSEPGTKDRVSAFRIELLENDRGISNRDRSFWSEILDEIDVW
jgi:hypothetical protein